MKARMLMVIGILLALVGVARGEPGDVVVLHPGSSCEVASKKGVKSHVDFKVPSYILSDSDFRVATKQSLLHDDLQAARRDLAIINQRLVQREPAWIGALRWGTVGAAIGLAFVAGAVLF